MTMLHNAKAVQVWLDQLGIDNVVVISPHLDDAVYSVAGFLSAARDRTEVITLFTEALPGQSEDWAHQAGFPDSRSEHLARRQEDVVAMNQLGCRFQHLGFRSGEATGDSVSQIVKVLEHAQPNGLYHTLMLLPAGAGGPAPRSQLWRLALRCIRRPSGVIPHSEHVQTRDLFWHVLAGRRARIGFYAELPYAWAHSDKQLQQHLLSSLGCRTKRMEHRPNLEDKIELVELYRSQLVPIFGQKPGYRRRVLTRNECIFVVESLTL